MPMRGENGHARWLLRGGGDNLTHTARWMWDENGHTRWLLCGMGVTWHTMWAGCKMRMATQDENGHIRWLLCGGGDNLTHNARWMWDENGHMKWLLCGGGDNLTHNARWTWDEKCEVRMVTRGENGHVRWLLCGGGDNLTHNMRWTQDEKGHTRWEWSQEVTFVWWNGQQHTTWGGCKMRMAMWDEICKVTLHPCNTTLPFRIHTKWQSCFV